MHIRKTSSALLLSLALAGIQAPIATTPAHAQQQQAPSPQAPAVCTIQDGQQHVINVNGASNDAVATAIANLKADLATCGDKTVAAVIKVPAGTFNLPSDLLFTNPKATVTIQPADNAVVTLKAPESGQPIQTGSAHVIIENVSVEFGQNLFAANGPLTLTSVTFKSKDGVAVTAGNNLGAAHKLTFNRPRLEDTALLDLGDKPAQAEINDLTVSRTSNLTKPIIKLPAIDPTKPIDDSRVVINRAAVIFPETRGSQAVIEIGRPNVTIDDLVHRDPGSDSTSIIVETPNRNTHSPTHQLQNVVITKSKFRVGNALIERANPQSLISTSDAVKFNQNSLVRTDEDDARPNPAQPVANVLPKDKTASPAEAFNASCNYWGGNHNARTNVKANGLTRVLYDPKEQENRGFKNWPCQDLPLTQPGGNVPPRPVPPTPESRPQPSPDTRIQNESGRISGPTRIETSVAASRDLYPNGTNTVILARADVAADSVSAVPLAQELNAPILLTMSDSLHPSVAEEIKRLMPNGGGRIIIMGGESALSAAVANSAAQAGGKVERIAGENRAATAVATATQLQSLGKATQVLLADGDDWQPDLIAGPVAARIDGVTLLTSGSTVAPETAAFLRANASLKVTAIGTGAAQSRATTTTITGTDAADLSLKVAQAFFTGPRAVGFATTEDFADPLVGGSHIAHHQGPLLLVNKTATEATLDWARKANTITNVYIYGGDTRISKDEAERLNSVRVNK